MEGFNIRTDLALEARERFGEDNVEVSGVEIEQKSLYSGRINITGVKILNRHGEEIMKKPIGSYITIESENLRYTDEKHNKEMSCFLAEVLIKLNNNLKNEKVLVAGLGNRDATPDALGPRVISDILTGENVYAVAPGVMAQTGMETADYIKAIVKQMKPKTVIAIDALAARSVGRVNTTIQISDTGICPGSGVGNHRMEISGKTLGVPVIAIGVPTVVDAATIVNDAIDRLINELSHYDAFYGLKQSMNEMSGNEKYMLVKEILEPAGGDMYVTPKDIDENVKNLSYIISQAINRALN